MHVVIFKTSNLRMFEYNKTKNLQRTIFFLTFMFFNVYLNDKLAILEVVYSSVINRYKQNLV